MPDYPGAPGRTGYAVGLDVPASVVALLADLAEAGYRVERCAADCAAPCSRRLEGGSAEATLSLRTTRGFSPSFPPSVAATIEAALGRAGDDPDVRDGAFRFRARSIRQCAGRVAARPRARDRTGAPTITTRRCRRGMRCSRSGSGCASR